MRNLIFDLGGTVFEWNPDAILRNYYADSDARAAMKTALCQHPDWLQMDRGTLTEAEALARLEARTRLFRGIVISGEIKMIKPEREIFEYLLRRYDLLPTETVFIDDHQPNIQAAQALGLHTTWFRDAWQCELELEHLLLAE
jgi:FMN phosphatase YigB (HAD superfamily)